jgi:uncharacterized membrane protein
MPLLYKSLTIFALASVLGWILESFYRSINTEKRLINPGFLSGPYLPLYGFGVLSLSAISYLEINLIIKILLFAISTTLLKFITGIIFINYYKIKLWDYSDRFLNFKGIIAPIFTFYWTFLSLIFYHFIYPLVSQISKFVISHQIAIFLLGAFYGILLLDFSGSINLANKIRKNLKEISKNQIPFEHLKLHLNKRIEQFKKLNFLDKYLFSISHIRKTNLSDIIESITKKK